jgi:hypothetical protein
VPKKTQFVPKWRILVPKRKYFLMNEEILNTRGDQAFYMGAENAKIESAEKSAETGGHQGKNRRRIDKLPLQREKRGGLFSLGHA